MSMNFWINVLNYVIGTISLCNEKIIEIRKEKKRIKIKDNWEYFDVIPLLSLLGVNHRQTLSHIFKYIYILIVHKNVLIHLKSDIWLTPHYMLTRCSEKILKNV